MPTPKLRTRVGSAHARPKPRTAAAWTITYIVFTLLLGGTVPTPMYSMYAQRLDLSPVTVSAVFAAFAVGALSSLVLFGSLSDQIGRRATIAPALCLAVCSCVTFALSPTLPGIIAGRLLCGLSVGLANGAATAYLGELLQDRGRAALTSSAANMLGLGVGALLSGALVEFVPAPLTVSYLVLGGLLLPGFALLLLPETVRREGRARFRPQRLGVPAEMRSVFTAMAVAVFGAFALLGLLAALAGKFLTGGLHINSHLMVGVVAFSAFGSAGLAQLLGARLAPRVGSVLGMVAVPVGLGLFVAALPAASLALFLAGSVIGGAGSGLAFRAGLAMVSHQAPPDRVGQVVSSYFAAAYLGLTLPVLGIGVMVTELPMLTAAVVFAIIISLLAALSITVTVATRTRAVA
ncbi:MFS transporter [Streptomyces sp. NPDC050355]|uniref:MFS transporter n=1 Tax=Streptomyces sp. NPDC050355 TaxID=3365609 RepID=UPI00379241CB